MPPSVGDLDWRRAASLAGLLVGLAVVGVFVVTAIPGLVGADQSLVVQSDSMSPSIDAGAVVFVNDVSADSISEGDVITFQRASGGDTNRVTHRVVEVVQRDGERRFRTKGDANEDPDPELVGPDQVVGRVWFHLPYVGYVVAFAGTQMGLVALVIVPAVVLAALELRDLVRHAAGSPQESTEDRGESE